LSEIRATTISDAAGTGPITLTGQVPAKMWARYDGSSVIADSFNISSATDHATVGRTDIAFTNNMAASDSYAAVSTCNGTNGDRFVTASRRPSMSTLKVSNIQATGETASRAVSGVAAAWANVNGVGTVSIRDSANGSSIVDAGTGRYEISLTNNLASINASAVAEGNSGVGQFNRACSVMFDNTNDVELTCFNTDTNTKVDLNYVCEGLGEL